jgi:hypothetical protein
MVNRPYNKGEVMQRSQTEFVKDLILQKLESNSIELKYGDKASDHLTNDMKKDLVELMSKIKIPYMYGMNYCPKNVCKRIIERTMKHNYRLNGGQRYQVKNPGSRQRKPVIVDSIDQAKLGEVCGLIIEKNKLLDKKRAAHSKAHYYQKLLKVISGKIYECEGKYYYEDEYSRRNRMKVIPKKWLKQHKELSKRITLARLEIEKARCVISDHTSKTTRRMRQLLRECFLTQEYWSGKIRGLRCKDARLNMKLATRGYGLICYNQEDFVKFHNNYLADKELFGD